MILSLALMPASHSLEGEKDYSNLTEHWLSLWAKSDKIELF